MTTEPNWYELIKVLATAGEDAIRHALIREKRHWRARASNSPTLEVQQRSERMVEQLNEAEKVLLDRRMRAAYDAKLSARAQARPARRQAIPTPRPPAQVPLPPPMPTPLPKPQQPLPSRPTAVPKPTEVATKVPELFPVKGKARGQVLSLLLPGTWQIEDEFLSGLKKSRVVVEFVDGGIVRNCGNGHLANWSITEAGKIKLWTTGGKPVFNDFSEIRPWQLTGTVRTSGSIVTGKTIWRRVQRT